MRYVRVIDGVDYVRMMHMFLTTGQAGLRRSICTVICNVQVLVYRYLLDDCKNKEGSIVQKITSRPKGQRVEIHVCSLHRRE